MSIPVIAFFNNKGGVGKTSMVYHLSWMLSDQGLSVVAADLDPQSNLTVAFLNEDRLEQIITNDGHAKTVFGAPGDSRPRTDWPASQAFLSDRNWTAHAAITAGWMRFVSMIMPWTCRISSGCPIRSPSLSP